ncbi:MAG: NAD(P)-dependent oxidoreductase [Proteobacteria bacterium]|nr:NAD(P)-dependent oxidoreductase [Pseudomonadota bacterium]
MNQANQGIVGIIGLGIMGSALADHLISKGFTVFGLDPDANAIARAKRAGVRCVSGPDELLGHSQRLISSLPSSAAFDATCDAIHAHQSRQADKRVCILAETSTLPLEVKQKQHRRLSKLGVHLLDCPLSGTGAQARAGDLIVYASGQRKAIASMMPVFRAFSRAQIDVGRFGNGMRMKLVSNLLVAIHNVAAAEAILLGKRLGLDPADVVRVVGEGAGASRMLQVRGPLMARRNWQEATMKLSLWQKDMAIIGQSLMLTQTPAPLFAASVPIYNAAQALGLGEQDTASVMAVLEQMVGEKA